MTGATKLLAGGTTEVYGRAYRYHFDGIGNRIQVEQSRDSGQADRSFGYTPDALNQYASMTHPNFIEVAGSALPSATVTMNSQPVTRQGGYFRKELSEDNSSGPQWIDASVTDGTTTTDGSLALPAASTTPTYDDDGNLTFDGLWNYTWEAENRLIVNLGWRRIMVLHTRLLLIIPMDTKESKVAFGPFGRSATFHK